MNRERRAIDKVDVARAVRAKESEDPLSAAGGMNENDRGFRWAITKIQVALGYPDICPGELGGEVSSPAVENTGIRAVSGAVEGGEYGAQPIAIHHRDDGFADGGLLARRPADRCRGLRGPVPAVGAMT